jgi:hypothetical protein
VILTSLIVTVNVAVYFASGQALQTGTERYLIMTVPALVLLFSSLEIRKLGVKHLSLLITGFVGLMALTNAVSLGNQLIQHWSTRLQADVHLTSVNQYQRAHPDSKLYASMITSLPLAFYNDSVLKAPLPLKCSNGRLFKNQTFYDKAAFEKQADHHAKDARLILDMATIDNSPYHCSLDAIIAQLGQPIAIDQTNDGSLVLVYQQLVFSTLPY